MDAQTSPKNEGSSRRLDMLLDVPLEVNVESGKNWGEMDELFDDQDEHKE